MALSSLSEPSFRAQLATAVAEVESVSSVELVVVCAPRSGTYVEVSWQVGLVFLVATSAALTFTRVPIGDYTLFLAPLAAFVLGATLPSLWPSLRRLLASKKAVARQLELVARATFQKAGLHATRDHTAVLVYCSLAERAVHVVVDRGVTAALPGEWPEVTAERFRRALRTPTPGPAVLSATRGLAGELGKAMPPREDDMNELPDAIDVAF